MSLVTNERLNYFAQGLYGKIKANFDAKGSANTAEANAKTYADGLNTEMDTRVDALETTVGNAESGLVKDVAILKGDKNTEGSVAYQVAQIVAGADASYDTLKEIADWIMSDQTGAAKMANDIKANADAITDLETLVGTIPAEATATDIVGYIAEYVQAQLTASDLSQYAKAEDFNALKDVVGDETKGLVKGLADVTKKATDNESAIATLNGADTVEGSVAKALKDGVTEAKTYADGLNTTMDGRMTAVETKANANETAIGVLNGADTVEGSVAKALKDAKDYADGLAEIHVDASADNKYDNATGMINLYLNDGNISYKRILIIPPKLVGLDYNIKDYESGDTIGTMKHSEINGIDDIINVITNTNYYPVGTSFYTSSGETETYTDISPSTNYQEILNGTVKLYAGIGSQPTKIEVPVTELKAAITAIGVETDTENSVTATGIYARLESLESVMGTASVKDDHGNVVTPATGVQKQIEDLQASQNEIITEAQIDEMINGLA